MLQRLRRWWDYWWHDGVKADWIARHPLVGFLNEPTFRRSPRGRFEVLEPLYFRDDKGKRYSTRASFHFDGGSYPMLGWFFVGHPMSPSTLRCFALHDQLIEQRGYFAYEIGGPLFVPITVKEANRLLFISLLSEQGVASPRALAIYGVVCLYWFFRGNI